MPDTLATGLGLADLEGPVVDCNLHAFPAADELAARLPDPYRDADVAVPSGNWASPVADVREGAAPETGPAGSSLDLTREQHLDPLGLDYAVLTGGEANVRASALPDRRYAAALCSAYNDWLLERWVERDDRLLGSVSVAPGEPEAAADEISRLGDHPDVVQALAGMATQVPLGQERYWPIFEAAAAEGLPLALHAGAEGYGVANPNTGAGYPSTDVERRAVTPANPMGQLMSLLLEGVFVEFPDLRVVFVQCGYGWVPSFLWRLDKGWKGLRDDMPWLDRPPSEYVREHVRFATHPLDVAGDPEHTRQLLEMVRAEETLLFGSNYPRRESYAPGDPLPDLDPTVARAVVSEGATALYDL